MTINNSDTHTTNNQPLIKTMIEPRSSLFHVHRRDNSKFDGNNSDSHFFFGGNSNNNSNNNSIVSGLTTTEFVIEHDEPERPIHPALEYEVLLRDPNADPTDVSSILINEDDQDQQPLIEIENGGGGLSPGESLATTLALEERKRRTKRNVKLILSFIFLVISGVGHVISLKLQAIPMYVNGVCHCLSRDTLAQDASHLIHAMLAMMPAGTTIPTCGTSLRTSCTYPVRSVTLFRWHGMDGLVDPSRRNKLLFPVNRLPLWERSMVWRTRCKYLPPFTCRDHCSCSFRKPSSRAAW